MYLIVMWKSCLHFMFAFSVLPVSWRHLLKTWRGTPLLPARQLHWKMLKMEPFFCVRWEKLLPPWKVCAIPFYFWFFSCNHSGCEQLCLWSGGINFHFLKDLKLGLRSWLQGSWREEDTQLFNIHPIIRFSPGLLSFPLEPHSCCLCRRFPNIAE